MSAILETREKLPLPQFGDGAFDPYRLRVEDYEKMIDHGIFGEDEKIELWEGVLVTMSPKGSKHANAVRRIDRIIEKRLGEKIVFSAQDPIRLDDFSEPEPDVALLALPIENYDERHPTPQDIYLVMEIADTSIEKDRRKAFNYARNGIRQYLLLNLNTNEIEDYREPSADGYRFKKTHDAKAIFNLVAFPEVEIKVADLLPPESAETR
ncbi:MAG: Uma2 family endonuclease [Pyrinomonadaceae bacterium]|nr:Uma2 family endonuclease [Pyrinomonadaceae bacterium]